MKKVITLLLIFFFCLPALKAEEEGELPEWLKDFNLHGLAYLYYEKDLNHDPDTKDRFRVGRAYFTMKKKFADWFKFRITLDIYDDDDGVEERLKYLYANFIMPNFAIFHKPNIEFGIVHTCWLDFEEHINYYRMQGTMFMERNKIFNSADMGVSFFTDLGGEMNAEYKKKVNKKNAGLYGSVGLGIYNGPGYHDAELNTNKVMQGRLTLRPLPYIIPGLQFSVLNISGKGNPNDSIGISPDWQTNTFMASYEHQYFTLAGQFVTGKGDKLGKLVNIANKDASDYSGFSVFGELRPTKKWRAFFRYDDFDPDKDIDMNIKKRIIAGIGYDLGDRNIILVDYDTAFFENDDKESIDLLKFTMQVHY